MYRIHIVGCSPRAGTTLLAEMMAACFDIDLYGEHEDHIHAWPPRGGRVFLTKHPGDIVAVQPALRLMPKLHVVVMIRDPRDVVSSRHRSDPDRYWAGLKYWNSFTPYIHRLRDHPRVSTVRYEDLAVNPDRVQTELMQAMPWLVRKAPFTEYHDRSRASEASRAALGGIRPVSKTSVGNWRNHLPRVAGQLHQHGSISEDLIAFGYEPDDAWMSELEGVEPDLAPGHWPEHSLEAMERRKKKAGARAVWAVLGQYSVPRALDRFAVRAGRAVKSVRKARGRHRR